MTRWRHCASNGDRGHPSLPQTWKQWVPETPDEKMPQGRQCAVCGAEPVEYDSTGKHSGRLHRTHDEAEHARWHRETRERFKGDGEDADVPAPSPVVHRESEEIPAPVGEPGLFDTDDDSLPF